MEGIKMLSAFSRLRIEKDIVTTFQRSLSGEGKIFVSEGGEVSPEDIIGVSQILSGFRIINLADLLWVKPPDVTKYIKRGVGQIIYKDELLAYKKGGFFSSEKIITSPTDGTLDFVNNITGEVRISLLPKKVELAAGVYGIVEKVDANLGVIIIRALVTKIYGVFGRGKVREGSLSVLTKRDGIITKNLISHSFDEHIIVGGGVYSADVLHSAISAGVVGLIIGGIKAADFRAVNGGSLSIQRRLESDGGLSIIVCEGFGSVGLGEDIYDVLTEYDNKFVYVDGNNSFIGLPSFASSSMIKVRSTILPKSGEGITQESKTEVNEVSIGVRVRVIGASFTGEQGKVVAFDKIETLMPSGVNSYMVTVETKRRKIQVPFKNIEII